MRALAAMESVLVVVEGSTDPAVRRALVGHDLECVAVHPDAPDRLLCGTFEDGLQRSLDGGEAWERVGEGTLPASVTAIAVDPADPDVVWAGTEPSAVYRSADGGENWTERGGLTALPSATGWSFPPRPHTHHVRWIEVDPGDSERLYVGIEAGALVRSRDGGETWLDRVPTARRDNHSMTTHPDVPGRVYAAAGDGYAETTDGGKSWRHPQSGLDHRYCWSVAVDPDDPDSVLLSAARGPGSAHDPSRAESYVYRRRDGGAWQRCDDLPTGDGIVRAVLATDATPGTCYALHNRGLYRTRDFGETWVELDLPWDDTLGSQTPRGLAVVH